MRMTGFERDEQVQKTPLCPICRENPIMVKVGGEFVCGRCASNHYEKQQKMIFEEVKNANRDMSEL